MKRTCTFLIMVACEFHANNLKNYYRMKQLLVFFLIALLVVMPYASAQQNVILPKPQSVEFTDGLFAFPTTWGIYQKNANATARYLSAALEDRFDMKTTSRWFRSSASVVLVNTRKDDSSEAYSLKVDGRTVRIEAASEKGLFYGVQSLLQLVRSANEGNKTIAAQLVNDQPRFHWRAFMLDESRYFKGEKEVLRLLDVMTELKMNIFHWHLTDDQGWRIEIKKYPLLTEIGSKRKDTQVGGWNSEKRSGEPHEGYYKQEEIRRIVAYAKERHIKVVPEIEMPGHASATIAAYPWLGSKDEIIEVPVTFGKHYPTYNVIDPRVKQFLKDVVTEVIELFDTDVVHIGGDEVRFDHWEQNPEIVAYKEKKGFTSFMDLQIEFTNEMSRFIADQGASMMGWNEILGKNLHADDNISFADPSQRIAQNVIVQFWKGDINEVVQAAKDGYRLVNSYHMYTYLDYGYNTIPLSKSYSFNPIPAGLPEQYHQNIYGLGCQMWSEWIPKVADMHRQIFPRIAAYAEVGWSDASRDYDDFVRRLKPVTQGWKAMGIVPAEVEGL
jgi:hexosaminidase